MLDYDQDKLREQSRDDLGEIWAREATPFPLEEGGWLMGSLEDLQGRFNLNTLADRGGERRLRPSLSGYCRPWGSQHSPARKRSP